MEPNVIDTLLKIALRSLLEGMRRISNRHKQTEQEIEVTNVRYIKCNILIINNTFMDITMYKLNNV